jgi:hypothetical protein
VSSAIVCGCFSENSYTLAQQHFIFFRAHVAWYLVFMLKIITQRPTTAGGVAAAGGGPQPNGIIPMGQGFLQT